MAKVLITGANSFVGRNYMKSSKNTEIDEISLINNKPEDINFGQYDIVLHLVAIVHQSKRISEREYVRVNTDLCIKTAKQARKVGVKQFVFMSTMKVYGKYTKEFGAWNEMSVCKPIDSYGRSKYLAEIELQNLESPDFIVSIVRTPLVYGKNVRANMLSIIRLVEKFPVLPLGNIQNKRSFTAIENLVAFIDRIIEERASGVFIAKDEKDLSTTELVKLISKYLDKKRILISIPKIIIRICSILYPRIFDRLYGSFELENYNTLKQLNFRPPFTIEEGIEKMILAHEKSGVNK